MYKTIKRIKAGGGRLEDLDVLDQMAKNMGLMPGTTICGLADGAAWPIKNVLAKFRPELEDLHQDAPGPQGRSSRRSRRRSPPGSRPTRPTPPLQILLPSPLSAALRSPHA